MPLFQKNKAKVDTNFTTCENVIVAFDTKWEGHLKEELDDDTGGAKVFKWREEVKDYQKEFAKSDEIKKLKKEILDLKSFKDELKKSMATKMAARAKAATKNSGVLSFDDGETTAAQCNVEHDLIKWLQNAKKEEFKQKNMCWDFKSDILESTEARAVLIPGERLGKLLETLRAIDYFEEQEKHMEKSMKQQKFHVGFMPIMKPQVRRGAVGAFGIAKLPKPTDFTNDATVHEACGPQFMVMHPPVFATFHYNGVWSYRNAHVPFWFLSPVGHTLGRRTGQDDQ